MIIYRINNKINNKNYIGATKHSLKNRIQAHITNETQVGEDIIKYGLDKFNFEILERITNINDDFIRERENYYIDKYSSIKYGYNNIKSQYATQRHKSEDLRKETLNKYRNALLELLFTKNSIEEIAVNNNFTRAEILALNRGAILNSKKIKFPIRETKTVKRLDNNTALNLIDDLKEQKLTLKQLASKYNVSCTSINNVNLGLVHYTQEKSYPINPNLIKKINYEFKRVKDITQKDIDLIIECLKENVIYDAIEKELNINRKFISSIDKGKYKGNLKINVDKFPIRPYKKKLNKKESYEVVKNKIQGIV